MIAFMVSAYLNDQGEIKTYLGMSHGYDDKVKAEQELYKTMTDYLDDNRASLFPGSVICWLLEEVDADPSFNGTGQESQAAFY